MAQGQGFGSNILSAEAVDPNCKQTGAIHAIEDVIEAGARDIGIIVGLNREQVAETVMSVEWDANIEFLYQGDPKGLAQTILVAEDFLDDDFVMYLGDNILKGGIVG